MAFCQLSAALLRQGMAINFWDKQSIPTMKAAEQKKYI
jgi:hypothetical protein